MSERPTHLGNWASQVNDAVLRMMYPQLKAVDDPDQRSRIACSLGQFRPLPKLLGPLIKLGLGGLPWLAGWVFMEYSPARVFSIRIHASISFGLGLLVGGAASFILWLLLGMFWCRPVVSQAIEGFKGLRCENCGYDLRGQPFGPSGARCPECGWGTGRGNEEKGDKDDIGNADVTD